MPYITDRLSYIVGPSSFIWKQERKYDLLIRYKVPKGTRQYLEEQSLDALKPGQIPEARTLGRPVKKLERGDYNFGFPGQAGNLHFNRKILSIRVTPINKKNR